MTVFRFRSIASLQGIVGIVLLGGGIVQAAETSAPSRVEAGPEEQQLRRRAKPPPSLEPSPPFIKDQLPPPEPSVELTTPTFLIRSIRIDGSTLMPPERLRHLVAPYEGRTVSLDELQQLTKELTRKIHRRGYVTSRASIPPQEVTEGVLTIRILEGRVGKLQIEGARRGRHQALTRLMRIKPGDVFDYRLLQRDLSRLNANPDRRATAVLLPGEAPGTTDVVLQVEEGFPLHVGYYAHNGGTMFTGRHRQGVSVGHSDLLGLDDQLVVRTEFSERSDFVGTVANYLLPLGSSGRTLGINVSHAHVELRRHFRPFDVEGNATVLGLTVAEPLVLTETWEAERITGFDWKRVRSRQEGGDRGKDELRVLRLGANVLEQDRRGRSIITSEVGIGFSSFLGGSRRIDPSASRSQTGGQFTRLTIAGGRLQQVVAGFQLLVRGAWQWTNDRLPPAETMRMGGAFTVRGYPEAEFLADYGYTWTTELRYPVPIPTRQPKSSLVLVGFVDGGAGFTRHPPQSEEAKKRLLGWGFGFRWKLTDYTTAFLDAGFPIGDTSIEDDFPRVYYALAVGF